MSGETENQPSGWTVDTALAFIQRQHDDIRAEIDHRFDRMVMMLDERHAAQERALEVALVNQQTAMRVAFSAADKAVQAALESAEKAVAKAEKAANERFAAVNEFRQTLSDQTANFMPRSEAAARLDANAEKFDSHATRADQRFSEITTRLDVTTGKTDGGEARDAKLYASIGAIGAVLGIILSVVALFTVLQR